MTNGLPGVMVSTSALPQKSTQHIPVQITTRLAKSRKALSRCRRRPCRRRPRCSLPSFPSPSTFHVFLKTKSLVPAASTIWPVKVFEPINEGTPKDQRPLAPHGSWQRIIFHMSLFSQPLHIQIGLFSQISKRQIAILIHTVHRLPPFSSSCIYSGNLSSSTILQP
jgi:hypothetical protein